MPLRDCGERERGARDPAELLDPLTLSSDVPRPGGKVLTGIDVMAGAAE
jgi:hypothetical protein